MSQLCCEAVVVVILASIECDLRMWVASRAKVTDSRMWTG